MRRTAALLILLNLVTGCTTTITPPAPAADPVAVYVASYGRHLSLLLQAPEGHLVEYAFGDWRWFALGETSTPSAVRALFFSGSATLGRRTLDPPGPQAVPAGAPVEAPAEAVARAAGAKSAFRFKASRSKVDALTARLDAIFYAHHDSVTWNPASQMWFVQYDGDYAGWHNCNHVTASWLNSLDCTVRGPALTSDFVMKCTAPAGHAAHDATAGVR